jgi:hypothetical protein
MSAPKRLRIRKELADNPELLRAYNRERARRLYRKDPEKHRARSRKAYHAMDAEQRRAYNDRYRDWARRAAGLPAPTRPCPDVCELCGRPPKGRAMALDHDHETGAFRGWLCSPCNIGIGALGDNLEGLLRAVEYLRAGGSLISSSSQPPTR